ncbi:PQQ-binding-like beta-propeller repeat protein [Segetibacter koreensis]|uniref:outer membrane protein assembly factor BamB family protein n=1 Tax=Segetibacter koreensis TaxID=398037 RepID=UPI00036E6C48|nr:PQQ-binding-like beta-propeller repeat protein [Segetibacter koreensis]
MKRLFLPLIFLLCIVLLSWVLGNDPHSSKGNWPEYLGGPDRNHYSELTQINASNVKQLKVAWEYHTLDSGQIQCNPIIVNGILYGMTATTQPFAVDAATGQEKWKKEKTTKEEGSSSRGLVYWENGDDKRILYTKGPWLYALNALNGEKIISFGDSGRTSLKAGLGPTSKDKMVISNTPGTVFGDLIIMPLRVSEGTDAPLGNIQAFNIKTGKLAWVFHTIPLPGEFGYTTWPKSVYKNTLVGAANNWSGMAVDRKRGILYVPTGSAAFDFYGGDRKGANLFANCLIALDAKTGKRLWHYQLVHHDILDRDPPAPPNLVTINHNGKKVDAVVQVTKQGMVFVFDRVTGVPVYPIQEKPVPASDVPGEKSWPTQPFATKPAPYARQNLTEADINPYSESHDSLVALFRKSRYGGPFTPLSKKGTIIFPGLDGGAEWGGSAADPDGTLYVNSNEMAWLIAIGETATEAQLAGMSSGNRLYTTNCIGCHGPERKGNPASGYPSLIGVATRHTRDYIKNIITNGKGMMPGFGRLDDKQKQALVAFLAGEEKEEMGLTKMQSPKSKAKTPSKGNTKSTPAYSYRISGYSKFLDKNGLPAVSPPWGTLNAIDLNTGEYKWKIPYGEYPELAAKGIPQTGSESYGGPVVTSSGLLFIAGTKDKKFRVYDKNNGKLLWETVLPAAAFATPSTYEVNGKQYIVMACGGTKLGAEAGDSYVAFALP